MFLMKLSSTIRRNGTPWGSGLEIRRIRLYLENDNEMQDGTFAEIENNDLTKDEIRYSYSYGGTTRRTRRIM